MIINLHENNFSQIPTRSQLVIEDQKSHTRNWVQFLIHLHTSFLLRGLKKPLKKFRCTYPHAKFNSWSDEHNGFSWLGPEIYFWISFSCEKQQKPWFWENWSRFRGPKNKFREVLASKPRLIRSVQMKNCSESWSGILKCFFVKQKLVVGRFELTL